MRDLRGRRAFGALAFAMVLGGGLSGCGGSDVDPYADEETAAPINGGLDNEDVLADPSIVVEGLTALKQMIGELVPKIGSEDAVYDNEALLPIWEDIEGRIKIDDAAAHGRLEAGFVALTDAVEKNDQAAGRTAADTLIREIDAYLAKPRTASPTSSPSSTATPAATSIPSSTPTPTPTVSATSTSTF